MKKLLALALFALVACEEVPAGAPVTGGGSGITEYLVLGSRMSYDDCRARGGLIIHDQGSPMYACDPRVQHTPPPSDEFNHPDDPA